MTLETVTSATPVTRTLTYREAIHEALTIELERDPNTFIMGEDIGSYGGVFKVTAGLIEQFGPDRVRDTPISEAALIGAAIGSAIAGKRPIVELMFMDFALVAADQLFNQAAKLRYLSGDKLRVPLTVRTQQAVAGGGPQHSQMLEAIFAHFPGFAIALPTTPADAKGLLATAIRTDDPTIVIEHRGLYGTKGQVPDGEYLVPFASARVARRGSDVTIVAYSRAVETALDAAATLVDDRIEAEVIDLRTIAPLDWATVMESVAHTHRLVIVHEANRAFGVGAEIAARITAEAWDTLDAPPQRICGQDVPVPFAKTLEQAWLPQSERVVSCVRAMLGKA